MTAESSQQTSQEDIQTTLNLLRDHGATLYLDVYGKDQIKYRERDDVFIRFGSARRRYPDAYTTCSADHVAEAIEKHGIRKVLKA